MEYCDPSVVISREQYYLDLLKPAYNILPKAGSLLGFKHSPDTKSKLSTWRKGCQDSEETIAKLKAWSISPENLERLKIQNSNPEHKEQLKRLQAQISIRVSVLDSRNNEKTVYPSISEGAAFIGCKESTIRKALKILKEKGVSRLIKGRYRVQTEDLNHLLNIKYNTNNLTFSQRIEVLDTLTQETTIYPSINLEAAKAISVTSSAIRYVLKNLEQKGVHKPIKNKYLVKRISN